MPNEPSLIEGYFFKKGSYTNAKRYFRLYNHYIFYFDVNFGNIIIFSNTKNENKKRKKIQNIQKDI